MKRVSWFWIIKKVEPYKEKTTEPTERLSPSHNLCVQSGKDIGDLLNACKSFNDMGHCR
jgi:hypothetical protein